MIPFRADGLEVYAWPGALSPDECAEVAASCSWVNLTQVVHAPDRTKALGERLAARMPGAPELEWSAWITLGARSLPWHIDPSSYDPGARWKLCLYLDPGHGGTVFSRRDLVRPPGTQGTIVLFDLRLEHCSGEAGEGPRRVLGLRARPINDAWPVEPR